MKAFDDEKGKIKRTIRTHGRQVILRYIGNFHTKGGKKFRKGKASLGNFHPKGGKNLSKKIKAAGGAWVIQKRDLASQQCTLAPGSKRYEYYLTCSCGKRQATSPYHRDRGSISRHPYLPWRERGF